jgi:hypothetical protein
MPQRATRIAITLTAGLLLTGCTDGFQFPLPPASEKLRKSSERISRTSVQPGQEFTDYQPTTAPPSRTGTRPASSRPAN